MTRNDLLAVLCMLLMGESVAAQSTSGPLSLAQGTYRLEGRCIAMKDGTKDETAQCLGRSVIVAKDPARPTFVFVRTDGIWAFVSAGDPVYSNGAKTATFPVSRLLVSAEKGLYLPGECVLNADSHPTLRCTIWLKDGKEVAATFDGDGAWSFSRDAK